MVTVQQHLVFEEHSVPALKIAKHEAFAQALHLGMTAPEAYVQAGYANAPSSAYKLAKEPDVAARVEELNKMEDALADAEDSLTEKVMAELINPTNVSHAWLTIQLYRNCILARSLGEVGAANKALELIGKTKGLFDNPDIPADVRKKLKDENAATAPQDRLSQVAKFAGLLGKHPGDFVEADEVSEYCFSGAPDEADGDE